MMLSSEDLTICYGALTAVKDVSLNIERGDYLCVVGENGSGKSTLLLGVLGLVKPVNGRVKFNGIKQNELGYLPQHVDVRNDFPASVREVVASGCRSRKERGRVLLNAEKLGVDALLKTPFTELSGGQRQRVLLARALCATDKLLLLDEPVTGLDPFGASEMYEHLRRLNAEGLTVMMVSHDVRSAVKYANKILHMQTSPLFFGTTQNFVESEAGKKLMGA